MELSINLITDFNNLFGQNQLIFVLFIKISFNELISFFIVSSVICKLVLKNY